MFFQKHRQNIASLRKKLDVLHDVLGFWELHPELLKKSGYLAKNVILNSFDLLKMQTIVFVLMKDMNVWDLLRPSMVIIHNNPY